MPRKQAACQDIIHMVCSDATWRVGRLQTSELKSGNTMVMCFPAMCVRGNGDMLNWVSLYWLIMSKDSLVSEMHL